MKINGAKAVAFMLRQLGINRVWGIPGAKILSLYNEMHHLGVNTVLVTNESSASFMADGYYRVSGKPGVCVSIPGPGLTNMITGIAEAFLDSSAMLIITVNPKKGSRSFYIHDVPQLEILKPIAKKIFPISSIDQIKDLYKAYYCCCSDEPGPVVVEIGGRITDQEIEESELILQEQPERKTLTTAAVSKIIEYISDAGHVGIYAGKGCSAAGRELMEMSKILSAPVATTISGRGVVPEDYELSTGYGFGLTGSPAAYKIFKNCDLILAIGVKFSEMATGGWGVKFKKMIHIDTAADNLDVNYPCMFSVQADAQKALYEINQSLNRMQRPPDIKAIEEIKQYKIRHAANINKKKRADSLHPAVLMRYLRHCLPRDGIISTDVGYHQLWSFSDFDVYEPGTYLTPADYQAMGFGIPAAIGAAMEKPDKKTVCVCGDGGFLISGFELLTAVREKIDLSVFVFNDGALGLIKGMQESFFNQKTSVDLNNPDFEKLADSIGVKYFLLSREMNLENKIEEILAQKGVSLIECKIVYDEFPLYLKGSLRNSWNQMPLSKKISLLYRYVKYRL